MGAPQAPTSTAPQRQCATCVGCFCVIGPAPRELDHSTHQFKNNHEAEKTTEAASSRRYNDACCTAHALEILGDRWALLIIRELMLAGPG